METNREQATTLEQLKAIVEKTDFSSFIKRQDAGDTQEDPAATLKRVADLYYTIRPTLNVVPYYPNIPENIKKLLWLYVEHMNVIFP